MIVQKAITFTQMLDLSHISQICQDLPLSPKPFLANRFWYTIVLGSVLTSGVMVGRDCFMRSLC